MESLGPPSSSLEPLDNGLRNQGVWKKMEWSVAASAVYLHNTLAASAICWYSMIPRYTSKFRKAAVLSRPSVSFEWTVTHAPFSWMNSERRQWLLQAIQKKSTMENRPEYRRPQIAWRMSSSTWKKRYFDLSPTSLNNILYINIKSNQRADIHQGIWKGKNNLHRLCAWKNVFNSWIIYKIFGRWLLLDLREQVKEMQELCGFTDYSLKKLKEKNQLKIRGLLNRLGSHNRQHSVETSIRRVVDCLEAMITSNMAQPTTTIFSHSMVTTLGNSFRQWLK